jgi:hypothetical protein
MLGLFCVVYPREMAAQEAWENEEDIYDDLEVCWFAGMVDIKPPMTSWEWGQHTIKHKIAFFLGDGKHDMVKYPH